MTIGVFSAEDVAEATQLANGNYLEEQVAVPELPPVSAMPDLSEFVENGLGAVAYENGKMKGFLCCVDPSDNHFGLTKGVFTPIHAHGAVKEDRSRIYSRLYQTVSEEWVRHGALSHAITLYAHDAPAINSFFNNGFGNRMVDAVRQIGEIEAQPCRAFDCAEVAQNEFGSLLPLVHDLTAHSRSSPNFVFATEATYDEFMATAARRNERCFVVRHEGVIIAFAKTATNGENFIGDAGGMLHISGAYAAPEYRGKGVFPALLSYVMGTLRDEQYTCLGVDFESSNPAAWAFWRKHFTPYTYGVVRRVDERVLPRQT